MCASDLILGGWRPGIKLNFRAVDQMNAAAEWGGTGGRGRGCRGRGEPPFPQTSAGLAPFRKLQLEAGEKEKKKPAKTTSSSEFMSCSSTQGHCGTQTHHGDSLRFFIGTLCSVYSVGPARIFITRGANARRFWHILLP